MQHDLQKGYGKKEPLIYKILLYVWNIAYILFLLGMHYITHIFSQYPFRFKKKKKIVFFVKFYVICTHTIVYIFVINFTK